MIFFFFFFSSRRRHTRWTGDWSSDVCSSDLKHLRVLRDAGLARSEVDGKCRIYRLQSEGLLNAEAWFARNRAQWERRLRSEERRVGKECRARWSADR